MRTAPGKGRVVRPSRPKDLRTKCKIVLLFVFLLRGCSSDPLVLRPGLYAYDQQRWSDAETVVYLLDGLAGIYLIQGRLAEAEVPIQRVLSSV
jgi:hypothetical protein